MARSRHRVARLHLGRPGKIQRRETFLDGRLEVTSARGVRGPERMLVESLNQEIDGRVLVVGSREGVVAQAAAQLFPRAEVHLFGLDAYELERARGSVRQNGLKNVQCRLGTDLPDFGTFDWVLLPVAQAGDAMLSSELLFEAHSSLRDSGKLLAGTDNRRDHWLHRRILETFGTATIHLRGRRGKAYIARKQPERVPRPRDFRRRFRARLLGQELLLESRPGVFSHGELDQGTLALSELAPLGESSRVIDLGCGSGALGIAAALAAPRGRALLVDSSARAAHAARENAVQNGAGRNTLVILAVDLAAVREGAFDLALATPPYYGDYRITEHFAREARRVLAPGGEFILVTKAPRWPREIIRAAFGQASEGTRRGYSILRAKKTGT